MKTPRRIKSIDSRLATTSKAIKQINQSLLKKATMDRQIPSSSMKGKPMVATMAEAQHIIGYKLHPYTNNIKTIIGKLHQVN
jgi:hypothetical protein